jgi:NAD(P)-dependent dehydrogenase (short-subunit alcohol dehydrogenase family)
MIDTNVKGLLYTIRAGLPHLLRSGPPIWSWWPGGRPARAEGEAVYAASKFAQVGCALARPRAVPPRRALFHDRAGGVATSSRWAADETRTIPTGGDDEGTGDRRRNRSP